MSWLGPLLQALGGFLVTVLKSLFGTDKPQVTTVSHPAPEVPVGGGETDKEMLDDLGL